MSFVFKEKINTSKFTSPLPSVILNENWKINMMPISWTIRYSYIKMHWFKNHNFQLVLPTTIPFWVSYSLFICLNVVVIFFFKVNFVLMDQIMLLFNFFFLLVSIISWVDNVLIESKSLKIYTFELQRNILLGMILFIISEIMLFFAFFWAFFSVSLSPSIFINNIWPPVKILTLNPLNWPLLNTIILLISGASVNWFYYELQSLKYLFKNKKILDYSFTYLRSLFEFDKISISLGIKDYLKYLLKLTITVEDCRINFYEFLMIWSYFLQLSLIHKLLSFFGKDSKNKVNIYFLEFKYLNIFTSLLITIFLGILFLILQLAEYKLHTTFGLDNIYGTVFYTTTGLHGIHVFLGVTLLVISLLRFYFLNFIKNIRPLIGITCTVWYWHFVDVVWLFLFFFVYLIFS